MKQIYFVITHTGTILSKIIKWYTKEKFTHVSIALDFQLTRMYSFGRLNPYNPFWGGFVHEQIQSGTFKRFKNTEAVVYSLTIQDKEYRRIEEKIEQMLQKKKEYGFNVRGLLSARKRKKRKKEKAFYCAEFVKSLLDQTSFSDEIPDVPRPVDFQMIKENKLIYAGLLRKYPGEIQKEKEEKEAKEVK